MPGPPVLEALDLGIERGFRQLVEGLSMQVGSGELVQVVGENGSGKTSLLRVLAGLIRYGYTGSVHRTVGALFIAHHSAVKGSLTPLENLRTHPSCELFRDDEAIGLALETVGLTGFEEVPAAALSAGQQRRVNLARLFLTNHPLWFLDEPFAAIDQRGLEVLEQRFQSHLQTGGAIVMTSHQPLSALKPTQRVALGQ